MFPFNEHLSNEDKTNHRTFMIEKTNFSIFLYGSGSKESGMFEEHNRDMRKINGCETLEGHVAETVMMAVHCPNQHILINPVMPCS